MNVRVLFLLLAIAFTSNARGQEYRVDTLARAPFSQYPVAIAFAPDSSGLFVFTEKISGRVRVFYQQLLPDPFITVSVESDRHQGLLGVTFHPSYPDTPFVYVYYTRLLDRSTVLERYRDSAGIGIQPTSLFIAPRMEDAGEDVGGPVHFGPDGMIYLSVGDFLAHPEDAQDVTSRRNYRGKILRLHPDGSHPADNPFPNKAIWAYGLRNCLGFTFDRETGELYCTEGGTEQPNKIFAVHRGDNLGWPETAKSRDTAHHVSSPLYTFEGPRQPDLTGIVVYRGEAFPRLNGKILFAGNAIPKLWVGTLTANKDSLLPEVFFTLNTGFSDLAIGPDGCIYLSNGPYLSSRLLRLVPVEPSFRTTPPHAAVQGVAYTYAPVFSGTPPRIRVASGPRGMEVDTVSWTVHWTPSNDDALRGVVQVTIRAENGAGVVDQPFSIVVSNVNDPPSAFDLGMPGSELISVVSQIPEVTFRWGRSSDPDRDTVRYELQLDTVNTFNSEALRIYDAGVADSLHVALPQISLEYFWRVIASDGQANTVSTPPWGMLSVSFVPAPPLAATPSAIPKPTIEHELSAPPDPSSIVRFTLYRPGYVRVAVFNLLGQEVSRVFDGNHPEGSYEFDLNTLQLPNGIYFYRIIAPGLHEMKKLLITRPLSASSQRSDID